jgi:benzoate/toluate 1,2-dioxygenase subunit beta
MSNSGGDYSIDEYQRFIYDEAALIDDAEFEAWLDLFAEDGIYCIPIDSRRENPRAGLNLVYDDKSRLRDRVRRLTSGFSHSEDPPSRTSHLLGNMRILDASVKGSVSPEAELIDGCQVVRVQASIARCRANTTDVFYGRITYALRGSPDGLSIRMKRIDLINSDRPLPALTFIL